MTGFDDRVLRRFLAAAAIAFALGAEAAPAASVRVGTSRTSEERERTAEGVDPPPGLAEDPAATRKDSPA